MPGIVYLCILLNMGDTHPKRASADHPILESLAARYSPYAFEPRPIEPAKILSCLEAARWAASSYNDQPWYFILAQRQEPQAFQQALACLVGANRGWAQDAGALILTVIRREFQRGGPNRVAEHDLGLSVANLVIQAQSLGVHAHQMAGIEIETVRTTYRVPPGHDPMTGIALGYAAIPKSDSATELAQRDRTVRTRRKLQEFVFGSAFGQPARILGESRP